MIIPDPTALLAALGQITEKALNKDTRRKFRIDTARETLKVDTQTTYESVEKLATIVEGEIGRHGDQVTVSGPTKDKVDYWKSKGKEWKRWQRRWKRKKRKR